MGQGSIVTWSAEGGISTKQAPLVVQPNSSLLVDNLRQERKGEWRTRAGTNHNVLDDLPGLNPPVMATPTPNGGFFGLCRQTDDTTAGRIYTDTGAPRWHAPTTDNAGNQLCAQTTPGIWSRTPVSPMKAQPSAWSAAQGGGLRITAWWSDQANNGIQVSLTSADGTSLFYSPQFTGMSDAVRPRCVFCPVANTLTMFYAESSTGLIFTTTWSCATGLVTVAPRIVATDGFVGVDCFVDSLYYSGPTVTLVYRNNANQLGFIEYNPATDTTPTAVDVAAVDTTKCLVLLTDPDASGHRFVGVTTSVPDVRVMQLTSAGFLSQNDLANGGFDAVSISGVAYQSGTSTPGWMIVYWSPGAVPELKAVKKRNNTIGTALSLTPSSFTQLIGLASNAWREPGTDSMRFMMYLHGLTGDLQDNYYEMALEYENASPNITNNWPEPQARLLPLNAGTGHESRAALPQVQRLGVDNYLTCLPRITRNEIVASAPSIDYGIDVWTVQYLNSTTYTGQNQGAGTNTQQCAYLPAGSLLQTATGQLPCAHGSSALPFKPVPTPAAGGALLANATYNYVQTIELADEAGNVWASDLSNPVEITLGAGQGQISVEMQNTPFENQARLRTVKLWATAGNGSEYFLLFAQTGTIAATVDLTFLHNIADSVLEGGEPISGELQGTITPAFAHIAVWAGRLWGVPRDFPTQIWFSKPIAAATSPVFPDNFLVDTDDGRGPLTGLAPMDNVIAAFKQSACYVNSTTGPANDGTGTFPTFQLVESANGAIAGSPLASTGAEVYFESPGGIWRVKSAQAADFVGAPIDAYLSMPLIQSPESVYGMVVVPEKNEVRINTTNYRFVHDTVLDIWERDTGGMNAGIVMTRMLGTLQAFFLANGQMWVEAPDSNTPTDAGTAYAGSIRSPWMRPLSMEGWLRVYHLRALGEALAIGATAQPTLTIYFDNDNSISESFQPRVALASAVGPIRADCKPRQQLCTAFSPQLTLPAGNASIRFDAWAALVEAEPDMQALSSSRNWAPSGGSNGVTPTPCPDCAPTGVWPNTYKTWIIDPNIQNSLLGSLTPNQKDLVLRLKNSYVASGQWKVVQSSTPSVMSTTTDLWVTIANISRPSASVGPYSWIVLQRRDGVQLKIVIFIDDAWLEPILGLSQGGLYTGGVAGTGPSAPDEVQIQDLTYGGGTNWLGREGNPGRNQQYIMNNWQSSDGACTMTAIIGSAGTTVMMMIHRCMFTSPGWTNPIASWLMFNGHNATTGGPPVPFIDAVMGASGFAGRSPGGIGFAMPVALNGINGSNPARDLSNWPHADELSGKWALWKSGLFSGFSAVGARSGGMGIIPDVYWTYDVSFANGGTYNDGAGHAVIYFNTMVLPWVPGVVPLGFTPSTVGPFYATGA
jgi:hypothetical protein